MRIKAILLLLALCTNIAWAVKMHPGKRTITQSDGTTLHIKGFGDHDFSYITTADGVLLYQDGTVFYIAEVCTDGTLASTGILAHDPQQRTAAETAAIEAQDTGLFASKLPENTQKGGCAASRWPKAQHCCLTQALPACQSSSLSSVTHHSPSTPRKKHSTST